MSLARTTWKVYGTVLKWYRACCRDLSIGKPWPVSESSKICFASWCQIRRGLKGGTLKNYLSGLNSLSQMIGGSVKAVLKGAEIRTT